MVFKHGQFIVKTNTYPVKFVLTEFVGLSIKTILNEHFNATIVSTFNSLKNTVKLGYNELYGTVDICSL